MNRHIYTRESDINQVMSLMKQHGITKKSEPILLSEIVLVPKDMETIQKKLTNSFSSNLIIVIQDDLTSGGFADLEKLFSVYFSPEQRRCFANAFLAALKEYTIELHAAPMKEKVLA